MPTFFQTPALFQAWFKQHAARHSELLVGFYKRGSGLPSISWQESVDEALCFGWIDGVRTRIDDRSYKIRFTPRKPSSTWSAVNIERAGVLEAEGRMTPPGRQALAHRSEAKSRTYAYEQSNHAVLEPHDEVRFRKNKPAWKFFIAQPPGYRHLATWHVLCAKRAETRESRLSKLIQASQDGLRL